MKNKKLLILSSLFLTFAMTSCGENFPSHVTYPEGDDGSVQTPYEEYDNGKRVESISFKENDVSLNLSEKVEYQIEASFAPSDAHNPKLSYISNALDVAVVDDTGKVTMLAPGSASISVSADNGVSANFNISGYIPATSIRINPHMEGGTLLDIYDTKQFSIAAEPANATQKDVTWSVVDKDGNPSTVAVISETGLLSFENAKGVHDVELNVVATSKFDESLFASEKVIVNDARKYASSVKINKDGGEVSSVDVLLGSPVQLEAAVDPIDHTNAVSWSSEDVTVATVDEGLVSAVKAPATTNVKASIDGLESKVVVNTTKVDVTAVSLDKTSLTLNKGEEATLVATVAPSDASFPDVAFVVADGSNEFVSIDDNGKVTAKKQTGATPAKVMAVSKDNNAIFAECSVTVTNKVTAIEIVNNYEKMYYGGETYTLSLNKTPYDCEDFDVTWTSSNDSIATVDADGVVTTNNAELTGTVTIEATVNGTDIGDFIDINIIKPAAPFTAGKMYLVGNRNYQASSLDFDHASWDDSDYAVELTSMPDPNYKNQWGLTGFHFERFDIASNGGDLFKIRSADWPEFSLDQSSTKSAYFTEEGNLAVSNSEKYDLYFKENLDDTFSLYIMSEFKNGIMYLVGNRDYHTGESSGVAGTDTSWNDSSKALALTHDEAQGQYHVANTFEANDEFKVRSDMFYDLVLGQDQATASIAHQDGETGNIILDKDGKFDIYFKSELGVWTVYMAEHHEPVVFGDHVIYGKFGDATDWSQLTMSQTIDKETQYEYTGDFAAGDVFVVHMKDTDEMPWFHYADVKEGCRSLVELDGTENIKFKEAGNYTIYADANPLDRGIWIKLNEPVGPSISFGINSPVVEMDADLEIPVTATSCSGITYSYVSGMDYVEIDQTESDDTKLVVHGVAEGTATIKALANDKTTQATINVECVKEAPVVLDGFYASINGTPTFKLEKNDKDEYIIAVAKLNKDDQIKIYDADSEATFYAALDKDSISGFEDKGTYILCNTTGYYLLCLKPDMGNDVLYIGVPVVSYIGYYALVNGGSKINLTKGAGDADHKENYSASLVGTPLKANDKIDFYGLFKYNDEEVGMALKSNIFPNPDDDVNKKENNLKPVTPGGTDFTVQLDTEGTLYFNVNNDDTLGFWLTDGPDIINGYWLQVDGVNVANFAYDKKEGEYEQYFVSADVEAGQTISVYNADTKLTFAVSLDGASTGFKENAGIISCTTSGTYDFYLKQKEGADQIYIGEHVETKTFTATFTLPDWEGTLSELKIHYWGTDIGPKDVYATMNGKVGAFTVTIPENVTSIEFCICFKQDGAEKWSENASITPEDEDSYQITTTWKWTPDWHFDILVNKIS